MAATGGGDIEELVKQITDHPGVQGMIIVNTDGIPIRHTFQEHSRLLAVQYSALFQSLAMKARSAVIDLDNNNDLLILRVKSQKHEVLVAPDTKYILIVVQQIDKTTSDRPAPFPAMASYETLCHTSAEDQRVASASLPTNAVSRNLSDLHTPTWLALLTLNVALRTVLFYPLQLAIARKRVTREDTPPSVSMLVRQAYRGEVGPVGEKRSVRGVYRGLGSCILGNIIGEVSYLHTMEIVREHLEDAPRTATPSSSSSTLSGDSGDESAFRANSSAVAIGGIAGDVVALVLVTPFAVVCNRQMTAGYGMAAGNAYRPFWATTRELWGLYQQHPPPHSHGRSARHLYLRVANGCRGLYAGFSAGVAELPASGVWWGVYSETKSLLYRCAEPTLSAWERERLAAEAASGKQRQVWQQNWFLSPTDNPALNGTAGVVASAVTAALFNPVSVVQTRMQSLAPEAKDMKGGGRPFGRAQGIAADLLRREGWRGFYKGTVANMGAAVLDGVVFSLLYELTKLGSDRQFLERL